MPDVDVEAALARRGVSQPGEVRQDGLALRREALAARVQLGPEPVTGHQITPARFPRDPLDRHEWPVCRSAAPATRRPLPRPPR